MKPAGLPYPPQALSSRQQNIVQRRYDMPITSIAMLDKDHHIHLIPADRVLMMSIEHSAIKKVENERFEVECFIKLSVEGFPHPLEDVIRFTFAASENSRPADDDRADIRAEPYHQVCLRQGTGRGSLQLRARLPRPKGMRDHHLVRDKDRRCLPRSSSRRCLPSTGHYRIRLFLSNNMKTTGQFF